jgi:hypothetical protein
VNHNEPIAWAVLLADGDRIYDVYAIEEEAKAIDAVVTGNHGVVPLCRSPTLTEAEQLAVAWAAREADEWDEEDTPEVAAHADALRGLAKRLF